jgi:hypothetical protein
MKIETNLGTVVALGVVIFIGGEVVGYYRCREHILKKTVKDLEQVCKD